MSIFAAAFVIVFSLFAIVLPWAGVFAYYIFSVMQMQDLFPHDFGESRVSLIFTGATIIGLAGASALKLVDWRVLLNPYSFMMMLLMLLVNLSVDFTSYVAYIDPTIDKRVTLSNEEVLETFNKTVVFFFIACVIINTRKKLEWCIYVLAFILLYYSYWANKVYLTGEFWLFGDNGRLGGPLNSNYFDENYLAMLYVLATPVLYYIAMARSNFFLRYGILLTIPLTWHALFLTGSRGGLLSLAVVMVYLFFRSFSKVNSIGMVVGLALAIATQSGHLLTRVDQTVETSEQLAQLEDTEEALDPRLISWGVAFKIMQTYPMFGVGVGNFMEAFPEFSRTRPHVAHNTFFQFSANCGVFAGLIYLWFFAVRLPTLKRSVKIHGRDTFPRGFKRDYLDDLLNSLFLGFFVVAIFLDLMIYEIMYFILMLGFVKYTLDRATEPKRRSLIDSIYRLGQNSSRRHSDDEEKKDAEDQAQEDSSDDDPTRDPELDGRSRSTV